MYGSVARLRLQPGRERELIEELTGFEAARVPGFVGTMLYRLDARGNEYMMVATFASKSAYQANAASAQQDGRFRRLRALLESDPEWNDGELIYQAANG